MVPNSYRLVFASNGFTHYWRRIQKSFLDFVGSSTNRKVLDPDLFSTPFYNKHLSLPIASVVFAAISSKIGFVGWHTTRGG